jgi:polyisoprenoid-binding protein YceI
MHARTARFLLPFALLVAALAGNACDDPTKGKAAAIVSSATPIPSASESGTSVRAPQRVNTVRWTLGPDEAKVGFVGSKITGKHEGTFGKVRGTVAMVESKIEAAIVTLDVEVASVKTDDTELDDHLKSKDFFDAARFPHARFTSRSIIAVPGTPDAYTITGNLELHGVTKGVTFPATITLVDGKTLHAVAEFSIKRKDFGIVYPGKPDDLIRDDVLLKLAIDAKSAG